MSAPRERYDVTSHPEAATREELIAYVHELQEVAGAAGAMADTLHREGMDPALTDVYDALCLALDALAKAPA